MIAALLAESHVTAVDWPGVLHVAQSTARTYGLEERLSLLPGNFHEVDFESEKFAVVIMANVTHLESEERNESLFRKAHQSLNIGGKLVVVDAFGKSGDSRIACSLYALGLALRTDAGQVHHKSVLEKLLKCAGFGQIEFHSLQSPPGMIGALIATKT